MFNQIRSSLFRYTLSPLLIIFVGCTVGAMIWGNGVNSTTSAVVQQKDEPPKHGKTTNIGGYLMWSPLREPFQIMASRLEKPGAEQIVFTGTLSRLKSENPNPVSVRLILEHPNRLRLEEGSKITVFDGSSLTRVGGELTDEDANEAETLLLDFPERLFVGFVSGNPMSQLGSRFRLDDGNDPHYKGPYYDVYQVAEGLSISTSPPGLGNGEFTSKRYFINSNTNLLERIIYERRRGNRATSVEVKLDDWRQVEKQQMPFLITRLEGGRPALQFRASAAVLAKSNQ